MITSLFSVSKAVTASEVLPLSQEGFASRSEESLICRIFKILFRALTNPLSFLMPKTLSIKIEKSLSPQESYLQKMSKFIQHPYSKIALMALVCGGVVYLAHQLNEPAIKPTPTSVLPKVLAGLGVMVLIVGAKVGGAKLIGAKMVDPYAKQSDSDRARQVLVAAHEKEQRVKKTEAQREQELEGPTTIFIKESIAVRNELMNNIVDAGYELMASDYMVKPALWKLHHQNISAILEKVNNLEKMALEEEGNIKKENRVKEEEHLERGRLYIRTELSKFKDFSPAVPKLLELLDKYKEDYFIVNRISLNQRTKFHETMSFKSIPITNIADLFRDALLMLLLVKHVEEERTLKASQPT